MTTNNFSFKSAGYLKAVLAALAGMLVFWACNTASSDGDTKFNLTPDSTWAKCDSLLVILMDTNGVAVDTLFHDTLKSLDQLKGLDASSYKGGKAAVRIIGIQKGGGLCLDQSRTFDDKGGKVVIDTFSIPGTAPKSIELTPTTLTLKAGDTGTVIRAVIIPQFADQLFEWSVDDPSIASLDLPDGPSAGGALVIPLKNGVTKIKVKAKQDGSKTAELTVQVGSPGSRSVAIFPESLSLFLGGPDSILKATTAPDSIKDPVVWSSTDTKIAEIDDGGKLHPVAAGTVSIKAKFGDASATAKVVVKRDIPILTVASKSGAAVKAPITFSPKATQEFGSIVMFKWDLNGDGSFDDSLPGPFLGSSVELPPQTTSFSKEGTFKAIFLVRDSEGNQAIAEVSVDIGNQAPEVLSKTKDTVVSINDFVSMEAKVRDAEGKVVLIGWDYNNDGKPDDSVKTDDSVATIKFNHKFAFVGPHAVRLIATDDAGKSSIDTVKVLVLLDPPEADMGPDISIIAGSPVAFSVKGKDKFGSIAKREIKIGSGSFINLGKQDTSIIVPGDTGKVEVIGRVTDDDDNSDEDTMVVTLLAPTKANNDLSSLIPSAGLLAPGFKPVTVAYSLAVGYNDSNVAITALTTDPAATIAINGAPATSGKISDSVAVKVGTTQKAFEIVVTAQDGNQKTYSVSVTRAPSANATLAKLEPTKFTLKPAFASGVLDYADTVAFAITSVTVKPTAFHSAAKITVNDTVVATGTVSKALPLIVGDNLITLVVTAQDNKTQQTYTVKVVRRAKVILSRLLAGNTVQTDSLEAPLGANVTAKIADSTGFHFTKWAVTEGTGTFLSDSSNNTKLTVKSATVRATGAYAINVYTITTTIAGAVGGVIDHPTITLDHGMDTAITVSPIDGQRILSVTEGGKPLSSLSGGKSIFGAKKFNLGPTTANRSLVVTFFKTYNIIVSATGTGTISPTGTIEVDSNSSPEITMTATGVHFWVSALTDNSANGVPAITGDRMAVSKYSLPNISANHTIAATFALRLVRLTVVGKRVGACPAGLFCAIACPIGGPCPIPPDSLGYDVEYASVYNLSTADSTDINHPFSKWQKDGVDFGTTTGVSTGALTGDAFFRAFYPCKNIKLCVIIDPCPRCVLDPPVLSPLGSSSDLPQSKEPDPN